jgi:prepilin signal peptidase PulO-like enzyme (type II secretory pathway)
MELIPLLLWLITGWVMGAVINLLADQLPEQAHLGKPVCAHCAQERSWGKYIALIHCSNCHSRRSIRSWIVQIGLPVLAFVIWIFPSARVPSIVSYFLLSYFILVAVIDIEHRLILGQISLAGVILGASVGILLHDPLTTLFGGIAGAGIMFTLYQMGRLFSIWVSRKREGPAAEEALGFGDVYIAAIIGLILGWPGITAGLFLAILVGGMVSGLSLLTMFILKKYQPFMALPYAPFLLLATTVLLFRP